MHSEFVGSVAAFKTVSYDLLDVDTKAFDDDYFTFRSRIKELEHRLVRHHILVHSPSTGCI
jgi:dynein heavy chain